MVSRAWFLEEELALLPDLVPTGGTCLDIGANRGTYLTVLSALVGDAGTVVAVEPQPGPLRTARALVRLFRLDNVTLLQLGIGDTDADLQLVVPYRFGLPVYGRSFLADAPALRSADLDEFHASRRRDVRVTTLDALVAEQGLHRVDFVKGDIEGAELRMLRGGRETIERHRPTLLLEIEDRHVAKYGHTAQEVLAWLTARGYRAYVTSNTQSGDHTDPGDNTQPGRLAPVEHVDAAARNYVFVPI